MNISRDYGVTMFGLTALQMPALISSAPKDSILSSLQVLGLPFNMSKQFLNDHVAFCPRNVLAGRYYTMFTSVYYHTDPHNLLQNLGVLAVSGMAVHEKVGRWHFLSIFTGGGFFSNIGMWLCYLMQRSRLKNGVLNSRQLPGLAKLDKFKGTCLVISFDALNSHISYNSATAGINAILSFGACCSAERVARRLRECQANHLEIVQLFDFYFISDMMNIVFTLRLLSADVMAIISWFLTECELFDQITTQTRSILGHGSQVGGMLFGVAYYYFMYRRR